VLITREPCSTPHRWISTGEILIDEPILQGAPCMFEETKLARRGHCSEVIARLAVRQRGSAGDAARCPQPLQQYRVRLHAAPECAALENLRASSSAPQLHEVQKPPKAKVRSEHVIQFSRYADCDESLRQIHDMRCHRRSSETGHGLIRLHPSPTAACCCSCP